MPLFDFQCISCYARAEKVMKVAEPRDNLKCEVCGGPLKRIIVLGHGGFQSTEPKWLDEHVRGCLQDEEAVAAGFEKPIENRADYDRYLKQHDIVPTG